ncbi:leucine-rich repeat extensin-like protein 2 [Sphaerodactylus townsendi]|uniref:Uncharacterized protein n=1 Tax=Sphaerodactylus townsendi TaxID=933632 RepID=A0ACB8EWN6_9SAUR|nr:leucine-rich repeat extensin-like protein 2 [Sphaerodactylus townsendi]
MVVVLGACLFYGCKFREFQKKEKLSEGQESEGIEDYRVKLLDDESVAESEVQEGTVSTQGEDAWPQRRLSKQVGWSPEPLELEEIRLQRDWSPEPSPDVSQEPSPEPPPLSPEPPPPAMEDLPPPQEPPPPEP